VTDIRKEIREIRNGLSGLLRGSFREVIYPTPELGPFGGIAFPDVPVFEWNIYERCSEAWEDKESISVSFDLPGFEKDEISVSFNGSRLVLSAKKIRVDPVVKDRVIRVKRDASVQYEMPLPSGLDVEKARAEYKNGVLTVLIPKREKSRTQSVKIE